MINRTSSFFAGRGAPHSYTAAEHTRYTNIQNQRNATITRIPNERTCDLRNELALAKVETRLND